MTILPEASAGEAIRAARQRKGATYTMRRVEELSIELAAQDDQQYERVPRTLMWNLENGGADYVLKRRVSPGKIRSLVQILWSGNTAKFVQETGIVITDMESPAGEATLAEVPLYLERERADQARRFSRPVMAVDFVIEVRTSRMEPIMTPGTLAYCLRLQEVRGGEVAVIDHPDEGLILATSLNSGRFRFERTQRAFTLPDGASVYGVVEWMKPVLSI